jgi:hypothetical protein
MNYTYDNSVIYNFTSAVHYHDKQLAPDYSVKFLALTSDVTHGIISQHCGHNKLSSWSRSGIEKTEAKKKVKT